MTPTKRGRSNSMFDLGLDKEKEELVARVATLARERFAPRAAAYDRDAAFPAEDFVDLFKAGLFGASIPREYGGLGLGPYFDDTFTLWMMTKELAKADLSLARCWEGHINSLVLLAGLATDAQKARWFDGGHQPLGKVGRLERRAASPHTATEDPTRHRCQAGRRRLCHRRLQSLCNERGRC